MYSEIEQLNVIVKGHGAIFKMSQRMFLLYINHSIDPEIAFRLLNILYCSVYSSFFFTAVVVSSQIPWHSLFRCLHSKFLKNRCRDILF